MSYDSMRLGLAAHLSDARVISDGPAGSTAMDVEGAGS